MANRSTLSWRLSGLSASTKYKFYVKACTAKGCGNPVTEEGLTMAQGSKLMGNMFSCEEALTITEKKNTENIPGLTFPLEFEEINLFFCP